jgi:hypothetical protein
MSCSLRHIPYFLNFDARHHIQAIENSENSPADPHIIF